MSGVQETKDDVDSEEELLEMRAAAEALEKVVADRLRGSKVSAEKKMLENRIRELKRKLEDVEASESTPVTDDASEDKESAKHSSGMTKFHDADGKLYLVIDKRDLPQRMEDSQGFRRACDQRRHRELLLSEGTLINADNVKQRLEARGGDNLLTSTVDTIWDSTALWEKVRTFKVFSDAVFDSFLKFKSHWKNYNICSLEHFVSGQLLEEDRSAIVMALDGQQSVFSYVYGSQWGVAWEPLKMRIMMGDLRLLNGPYLRFELEVAWSSFCTIMRNAYFDSAAVHVDISQQLSCIEILKKLFEGISSSTAREMVFQRSLSSDIIRHTIREKSNEFFNTRLDKVDLIETRDRKISKKEDLVCIAQLLHVYQVNGKAGKKFDPCPHGKTCLFAHVGKKDKPKETMMKAVNDSRAKLLSEPIRRSLILAIQRS